MVASLPISESQILTAATELIAEHGDSAINVADKKIHECKASGFYSVANAWRLIREVIRDVQESDADL